MFTHKVPQAAQQYVLFAALLICFFSLHSMIHGATINLYISQAGLDSNSGNSTQSPFLTVYKASQWIKNYKNNIQKENTTFIVNIDDGRYFVNSTITIAKSSKFNDQYSPVYWQPLKKEKGQVMFTGGVPLPASLWRKVESGTDPKFDMLPLGARGKVLKLDLNQAGFPSEFIVALKSSGFESGPGSSGNELFFKRRAQTIARFPNRLPNFDDQYLKFASTDGEMNFSFNSSSSPNRNNWSKETHPHAFSYWTFDWADGLNPIQSISSSGSATLFSKPSYGIKVNQRFFLVNFLSELDQEGEYVILDGVIYFWPPSPITKDDDVIISVSEHILDIFSNAQIISNINFEMCRGIAVKADHDLKAIIVQKTIISNIGNRGIALEDCNDNCQALSNTIYEIGQGGISISGGNRDTLTPCNALIMNNEIFNYSRIGKTYRPAISVRGVGVTVRNNELYNADHVAILWGGNNHDFAYNSIHDVCKSTGDAGAIYSGRDWTMRGNLVRYNYIYRINGPGDLGTTCVYLDDQFSSITMYGNILVDCYRGLLIGGGRDNKIYGNVFLNNSVAISADDRGFQGVNDNEIKGALNSVPYQSTIWAESYPQLPNILNEEPGAPKGNVVHFNAFVGKTENSIYQNFYKYSQFVNNTLNVGENIFVNAKGGNYAVTENASKTLLMNTKIPFSDIGIKRDLPPPMVSSSDTLKPNNSTTRISSANENSFQIIGLVMSFIILYMM